MEGNKNRILMVTIPIGPPWDNASKNRAYNIALHVTRHRIHLLTKPALSLPQKTDHMVFEEVYRTNSTLLHKLLLGWRLLQKDPGISAYHFFFQPTAKSATLFRWLLKFKRKVAIQTVLNVFHIREHPRKCIFGDLVLVSSEFMRRQLLAHGIENVRKINPGVDCEKFSKLAVNTDLRESLKIGRAPAVLYAGEYTSDRGIDHILGAVKRVLQELPSTKFIFACRVFNRKDLTRERKLKAMCKQQGLAGNIIFLQTFSDMAGLLRSVDITIFPTLTMVDKMDIPMTLLESLAMERPIVISDLPPLSEIMQDEVGIKVLPGDEKGLAHAMVSLLNHHEKRKRMGRKGREMVLKNFNIKKISNHYEALYSREVLDGLSR
jgi:glycosyltransferase involved in cell wall biosynthesis